MRRIEIDTNGNPSGRLAVSPGEAARLLGIGRTKLYELLDCGALPSLKIGSRRLVRVAELDEYLRRLQAGASGR